MFCRRVHPNQLRVPLTRLDSGQGSFAPSRLNREFFATMNPSDSATWPIRRLWLPAHGCPTLCPWTPSRVSQVPNGSFSARCLLPPRGAWWVQIVDASPPVLASPSSAGWPLPFKRNEAEPSSRTATARTLAASSFGGRGRPQPLWIWLHDFRLSIMINTFQLTRTAKLAWRFPMDAENAKQNPRSLQAS